MFDFNYRAIIHVPVFQQLTASIVYTKPEKPLEFMMQEVERMKMEKEKEQKEQKKKS